MSVRIQIRRGTAAEWAAANPDLAAGEQGYETDTGVLKLGDGTTAYNSLAKFNTPRSATYIIAATDCPTSIKSKADHVTDNLDDGTVQTLLTAAAYGKVLFLSGATGFSKTAAAGLQLPSNITIELQGKMTLAAALNVDACFFKNANRTTGNNNITITGGANAIFDCNRANQTAGEQYVFDFLYVDCSSIDAKMMNYTILEGKKKESNVTIKNHKFLVKPILIHNCDSLTGFSFPNGTGTLEETGGISGTKCVKLTATHPGTYTSMRADLTIPSDIDPEAYLVRFWVKIEDVSSLVMFDVGGNTYSTGMDKFPIDNSADLVKIIPDNAWIQLQVPLTFYTSISPPNRTLRIRADLASNCTATAYFDDIWLVPSQEQPALSFIFDDGIEREGMSTLAAGNIISKYRGKSSAGFIPYVGEQELTVAELDLLYNQYGWDMFTHGLDHFDTLTDEAAVLQTNRAVNFLVTSGYTRGSNFFVFPGHDTRASTTELISKMFRAYRNPLQVHVWDRACNRLSYAVQAPTTGSTYSIIDTQKNMMRRHIWVCNFSHYIGVGQMTPEWLDSFCSYWYEWGMQLMAPSAVLNDYGHPCLLVEQYKMTNTGTATITAGQTSVDVTHGLVAAPARVLLTPTTTTDSKIFYVSAKAATTFTITIDSASAADITFDWEGIV